MRNVTTLNYILLACVTFSNFCGFYADARTLVLLNCMMRRALSLQQLIAHDIFECSQSGCRRRRGAMDVTFVITNTLTML